MGLQRHRKGTAHKRKLPELEAATLDPAALAVLSEHEELLQLRAWRQSLLTPLEAANTFDLNRTAEKEELARELWRGGYAESLSALREANPAFVQVVEAQVVNQHDRKASDVQHVNKKRLVDGILIHVHKPCTIKVQYAAGYSGPDGAEQRAQSARRLS